MPQEQIVGSGKLYFGKFPTEEFTSAVMMEYLGNTPAFSMTVNRTTLDHFDADNGIRVKDISIDVSMEKTSKIDCDNISLANLSRWFTGDIVDEITEAGSQSEDFTGRVGMFLRLGVDTDHPGGVRDVSNVELATPGTAARGAGTLTFSGQPTAADTLTIGGVAITYVSALTTGNQVLIGATATDTAQATKTFINANKTTLGVSASGGALVLALAATAVGTAGNKTLAKSGTQPAVSGVAMTGGVGTAIAQAGNWSIDLAKALLYIEASPADIEDGDSLVVFFDVAAATKEVVFGSNNAMFGRLMYVASNARGSNRDYTMAYVRIAPDGDYNLKTDNAWVSMSFTLEILKPPVGPDVHIG